MSTIESSKTMALIGSILLILSSVVPYGGIVVGIILGLFSYSWQSKVFRFTTETLKCTKMR